MTDTSGVLDTTAAKNLVAYIERIERLEEERKTLGEDIRNEFEAAKGQGFDPKIMKIVLKRRKRDADDINEEEALTEVYLAACGML